MNSYKEKLSLQRQTWIDIAKGIGILLVVFAHINRNMVIIIIK